MCNLSIGVEEKGIENRGITMATIKEIAEIAGISRGTVDRVLNDRGSVNPQTAQRIRDIAHKLQYQPNKAGLALAAQKKNLKIGVILFQDTNPFFKEVMKGITCKAEELSGYNCTVLIKQVPFLETSQCDAMEELLLQGIHGLVISPCNALCISNFIDRLSDIGIPVITFNTDILSKRIAYVGSNYYLSGQTAGGLMSHMTFGPTFVGIVNGSSHILCHTERIAGFKETIMCNYNRIQITDMVENHDDDIESFEVVNDMLSHHREINALFFAAAGVYGGCKAVISMGLQEKIKIFTFDNVDTTKKFVKSGLITATICQQPFIQGYKPLDLLSHYLLEGVRPEEELNYVATDIRIRENIED